MTPPSELSATWSRITGALQTIMSPEVYGLWFPKFSLLEDSGKALTLVCDDPMAALWVENSYTPELKQAAYDAGKQLMELVKKGITAKDIVKWLPSPLQKASRKRLPPGPKRRRRRIPRPHRQKNSAHRPPGHA